MRNGKIARLPYVTREELNRRLRDAEGGEALLEWLNSLEPVKKVLAQHFNGSPINAQNLTEWRQGGFVEWCERMEARQLARDLEEEATEVDGRNHQEATGDHLAAVLMLEFARMGRARLRSASDEEERWERLQELLTKLSALRRTDQRAAKVRMERSRWEREEEAEEWAEWGRERERRIKIVTEPVMAKIRFPGRVQAFGGGKTGWIAAVELTAAELGMQASEVERLFPWKEEVLNPTVQGPKPGEGRRARRRRNRERREGESLKGNAQNGSEAPNADQRTAHVDGAEGKANEEAERKGVARDRREEELAKEDARREALVRMIEGDPEQIQTQSKRIRLVQGEDGEMRFVEVESYEDSSGQGGAGAGAGSDELRPSG